MKGGEPVALTKTEFHLLAHLAQNPESGVVAGPAARACVGLRYNGDGRLVDTHVARLRAKIEDDPARPDASSTRCEDSATGCRRAAREAAAPGLRARSAAAFALLALLLSVTLSVVTYQLARVVPARAA